MFPLPTWVRVCLGIRDQGKPMQNPQGRVWNHRERTACRLLFCSASFPLRPKLTCPGMALLNYLLNQSANMLVSVESHPEYDLAFEYDFFLGSVAGNPASLTPRDTANKPSCFESQRMNLDAAVVDDEDQREVIPVPPVFFFFSPPQATRNKQYSWKQVCVDHPGPVRKRLSCTAEPGTLWQTTAKALTQETDVCSGLRPFAGP